MKSDLVYVWLVLRYHPLLSALAAHQLALPVQTGNTVVGSPSPAGSRQDHPGPPMGCGGAGSCAAQRDAAAGAVASPVCSPRYTTAGTTETLPPAAHALSILSDRQLEQHLPAQNICTPLTTGLALLAIPGAHEHCYYSFHLSLSPGCLCPVLPAGPWAPLSAGVRGCN